MTTDSDDKLLDDFVRRMSRPGDMTRRQQLDFLGNPLIRGLARFAGVDMGNLDSMMVENDRANLAWLRAAAEFTRLGWTPSARGPDRQGYVEAVEVWDRTRDEAAIDECLTRWWNHDMAHLLNAVGPILSLAGRHDPTLDLMLARDRLIKRALKHHENGEYEASVMILLAQTDGVVFDFTNDEFGFFYKAKDGNFVDVRTVAGMELVLRQVRKAVNRGVSRSTEGSDFRRHAILHGRVLGFGTRTNSTKAIALLGGVIEWLGPIARVETDRRQVEHEARWAGSDAVDVEGRRMDRRGFRETRESLRWLAIREGNEHAQNRLYRADLLNMFPDDGIGVMTGAMPRRDAIRLAAPDDRQSWWAWAKTDSEFSFGIAGEAGLVGNRYYAGVGPPGPPESDSRWTGDVDRPPDWEG